MWVLKERAHGFLSLLCCILPGAQLSSAVHLQLLALQHLLHSCAIESIFGGFKNFQPVIDQDITFNHHCASVSLTDDYIIAENSRFDVFVN